MKFQIGYAVALEKSSLGVIERTGNYKTNYSVAYGSLGAGLRMEIGYVRALTESISLQLDGTYLIGKRIPISLTSSVSQPDEYTSLSVWSRFVEISPLVHFMKMGNRLTPFIAIGPVIGRGKFFTDEVRSSRIFGRTEISKVYDGSVAVGAKSVLGVILNGQRLSYYLQLSMIAMSYSPARSEEIKHTENGVDELPTLSVSEKQTIYLSRGSQFGSIDSNEPSRALKSAYPFNSIGLNAGLLFRL